MTGLPRLCPKVSTSRSCRAQEHDQTVMTSRFRNPDMFLYRDAEIELSAHISSRGMPTDQVCFGYCVSLKGAFCISRSIRYYKENSDAFSNRSAINSRVAQGDAEIVVGGEIWGNALDHLVRTARGRRPQ
jgi:hypothetical protein